MLYSGERNKLYLYTKHVGFINVAMQNGASLVPILTYGLLLY